VQLIANRCGSEITSYDAHNTDKLIDMAGKKDEKYYIHALAGHTLLYNDTNATVTISGPFDHFTGRSTTAKRGRSNRSNCSIGKRHRATPLRASSSSKKNCGDRTDEPPTAAVNRGIQRKCVSLRQECKAIYAAA
jgi:hypothetical protein